MQVTRPGSPVADDGLGDARACRSASSSRHPRTRSIASVARGGPATCRMRSCPSSARCRTAERAPRYWSIDTTMRAAPRRRGGRRSRGCRGRVRAPSPARRLSMTISTIASTRCAQQRLDGRLHARRVVARGTDRVDAVPRSARREVEVHRDRRSARSRRRSGRSGRWCACACVTSARAGATGCSAAGRSRCSTRSRVAARTLGESFSTRETVWCETPASRATSKMLGARSGLVSATFVVRLAARTGRATSARSWSTVSVGRAHGLDDPAVLQDRHPVTDAQHLLELGGDEHHRQAVVGELADTRFWISTFAPTSMPRVGSSSTSTRGREREQARQQQLLLVAARQRARRLVQVGWPDVERLDPAGRELALTRRADPAQDPALRPAAQG